MNPLQPTRKAAFCPPGDHDCPIFLNDHQHAGTPKLLPLPHHAPTRSAHLQPLHLFPTVDVPHHAHYIIGSVILVVGVTGMLGNTLVIYVFCRCSLGAATRANGCWGKSRLSSASESESFWTESEADGSRVRSMPFVRRLSADTALPTEQDGPPPAAAHAPDG